MNIHHSTHRQELINGISVNADAASKPFVIDGCDTLVKLFAMRCADMGGKTACREKELGIWRSYSWNDYFSYARLIGLGLVALGLRRGDVVSILSEDSKEWLYIDMGAQSVGAIVSGVYPTDSPAQLRYQINDSGSRFLFVENDEQLDKYLSIKADLPCIAKVIILNRSGLSDFSSERAMFIDDLYSLGREFLRAHPNLFDDEIGKSQPEDTAILVYTSGTTGPPKAAMISHSNLIFSLSNVNRILSVDPADELICFLPLCHILERLLSAYWQLFTRATLNFAESPETVFENIQEVSPHIFTAVPRVWEKIFSKATILSDNSTWLQKWAFRTAVQAGMRKAELELAGKPVPVMTATLFLIWDFLVLSNVRRIFGLDRLRRGGSGAAPISPELLKWFHAIGITLREGYGMTESSGLIAANYRGNCKIGTVGKAIPGSEIRIAADGEIQYRAGNVFEGYWNSPDRTLEAFTKDGWLKTGDIGKLDEDGYLTITGRLKDLIITAGGKNVAPARIENQLKFSPFISDAVVIGDKRKFLTCLIMIDRENVEKFAQSKRVPFRDFRSLCAAPEVNNLIAGIINETNGNLERAAQIKDFRIIETQLTAGDEELTATMKLKRNIVEVKHRNLIDAMYC